jgi:hypothetical protein
MKKSVKAALLPGLIVPGPGHLSVSENLHQKTSIIGNEHPYLREPS